MNARLLGRLATDVQIVPATSFYRLSEAEFGMPGLVAIESVGPFVEIARLGPFITIHDSFLEAGLGIGHHPHQGNERLFYILQGEIEHDDSLNGIRGVMREGDLVRLTEGDLGMLHREWNGRDDERTHAFILVYPADPPVERASFDALRAADAPRISEASGVETIQLVGGRSTFRARNDDVLSLIDSTFGDDAELDVELDPDQGLLLYPLEGALHFRTVDGEAGLLRGASSMHPEGPDELAVVWSTEAPGTVHLETAEAPARLLRIGFRRGPEELVRQQPWRQRE